jgi:hypothetical protein
LYEDGEVKLQIYSNQKHPTGYKSRDLIKSNFAIHQDKFNYDYIKNELKEVFEKIPRSQIEELLHKVNYTLSIGDLAEQISEVVSEQIQETIAWQTEDNEFASNLEGDEYLEFAIELRNEIVKKLK